MTPEFVHTLFGLAAYSVGFAVFRYQRRRADFLAGPTRWTLVVAAVLGAAAGAKVLHWLANPSRWSTYAEDPTTLLAGNTLVGGLLGGWIAVEVVKARLGITERTGDHQQHTRVSRSICNSMVSTPRTGWW
ncbi:MAG: hypothetical protein AAGE94_07910 [Acidobacteriota bacterium]